MTGRQRRIGLFGGTFDPPHNAHLAMAHAALQALQLDELRWMPTRQPMYKSRTLSAAAHREAMVRLAIAGEPRFVLERCELEREGPSYTIDTLEHLQPREPGARWYLLIGADQYEQLHTWRRSSEVLARVSVVVAGRPGSAPGVNAALPAAAPPPLTLALAAWDISATDIRARSAQGLDISHLVPAAVAGYIGQQALYS